MLDERQFWKVSPGERAKFWEYCKDRGVIGIGWCFLGNLNKYKNKYDFRDYGTFKEFYKIVNKKEFGNTNIGNNAKQVWNFYQEMQKGDVVVANNGIKEIVGIGIVISDYYYDPDKLYEDEEFYLCHFRDVKWIYAADIGNGYDISDKIKKNRWANITVSLLDKDRELIENVINELDLDYQLFRL